MNPGLKRINKEQHLSLLIISINHYFFILLVWVRCSFVINSNTKPFNFLADGHGRSGADNWSSGADHPAAHDPPSWETTPVGVF